MNNKITNLLLILFAIINIANVAFATDSAKILEHKNTVDVLNIKQFDESIQNQITESNMDYKLINVSKQDNFKTLSKSKTIKDEVIVTTNDRYEVLTKFDATKNVQEEGYEGILSLDINSLEIKVNDSYTEEYKVYLQKSYTNIDSNELNSIPKQIVQDGITYYLVNPTWEIADIQNIEGGNIPLQYNGTMYYEGIKTRTIIRDYLAKISYMGIIEKELLESITYTLKYEAIQKQIGYTIPTIASGSIIFFSGLIILKRKNVKVYNYNKNQAKLMKKIHIDKNSTKINITPLKNTYSNKYKIVLSNRLYNSLRNKDIKIKYFDKEFFCPVKDKTIELFV